MDSKEIQRRLNEAKSQNWYHRFEVIRGSGIYTPCRPGQIDTKNFAGRLKFLGVGPDYFSGKRVLDIGALTGAFSFFLEDCGAKVVALDVWDPNDNGFNVVHEIRNSTVEHRLASVYDLNPDDFGYFDIVAFFGVYYHLKHPLLALERLNSVCREGSELIGGGTSSDRWFHDRDESCQQGVDFEEVTETKVASKKVLSVKNLNQLALCGFAATHFFRDKSNWFIANRQCVIGWLEASGFEVDRTALTVAPIDRDWNNMGVQRSTIIFKARKVGVPTREYTSPVMVPYTIPTSLELDRASREISELKAALKKHEGML